MSKASEWAAATVAADAKRPTNLGGDDDEVRAVICTDGSAMWLHVRGLSVCLTADKALKVARWITDTFGEQP